MNNQLKIDKQIFPKKFHEFFKQQYTPQQSLQNNKYQQQSLISPSKSNLHRHQVQRPFSYNITKNVHKYTQKIPHQQGQPILCSFINSILLILFLFFMIDLYFQIEKQLQTKEKEIKKCYEQFNINNCQQPIDALIQQCQYFDNCYKMNAVKELRYSRILVNTIFSLIGVMVNQLGITGTIVLALIIVIYLFRSKTYAVYTIEKIQ